MIKKAKVLFLCTGNSCRSQMAEAFARAQHDSWLEAYSAGIVAHGLNPVAVEVMAELGINMSTHASKKVADLGTNTFDLVVTVCGHADERCPVFATETKVIHQAFDDPPKLAAQVEGEAQGRAIYRRVRDEIKTFIETLPVILRQD